MTRELVPADELTKVKRYLVGHLFLDVESTDSLANFLGLQEVLTKKVFPPEEVAKKIEAVSADDIMRVAKEIFKNERLNMALIGPYKEDTEFKKVFTL